MTSSAEIPSSIKEFCHHLHIPNERISRLFNLYRDMIHCYTDIIKDIELNLQSSDEETTKVPDKFESLLSSFQDLNQTMNNFDDKNLNEIEEEDLIEFCDSAKDVFSEIIRLEDASKKNSENKSADKTEVKVQSKPEVKRSEIKTPVKTPVKSPNGITTNSNKNLVPIPPIKNKPPVKHYDEIWGEDEDAM